MPEDDLEITTGDLFLVSFDRQASKKIKKQLYQFSKGPSKGLRLIDCGMITQRNPEAVVPVLHELKALGALVVLIGAPVGFMRYQMEQSKLTCVIRESNLDDDIHFRQQGKEPLIQYIGTQRHLVTENHLQVEGHLRLSELKHDIQLAEPCIRDADTLLFHVDSMCAADAGYISGMSASGLNVFEACQLFRYAGASQTVSTIGIYGYDPQEDESGMMANALAQMIWYAIEGSTMREDPEQSRLTEYHVQMKDHDQTLQFFKSEHSGRWWIRNQSGRKVACSYLDYRRACEDDYSERVIRCVME